MERMSKQWEDDQRMDRDEIQKMDALITVVVHTSITSYMASKLEEMVAQEIYSP